MFPEQRPVAAGTLRGDERVRRIDLRWGLYAYLLQDRTELFPVPACGVLRLPHIDNAEAALSLSGDVNQKSFDGPVRGGVHPLAIGELSHRFLVALPRQTCSLMNEYDRHGYLLAGSGRRKNMTRSRPTIRRNRSRARENASSRAAERRTPGSRWNVFTVSAPSARSDLRSARPTIRSRQRKGRT